MSKQCGLEWIKKFKSTQNDMDIIREYLIEVDNEPLSDECLIRIALTMLSDRLTQERKLRTERTKRGSSATGGQE